ncbi:MAG TPA: tRNA lysidine(34) synthetase TilS [Nitrospiraceae bacterium]|nr:tRNA lysidine(34) synthetase TilS [Nitrospiraceae bacterium]
MKASAPPDTVVLSPFVRHVADTITRTDLFRPGEMILVAVSGGPDSVALLSVLAALAPSWRLQLHAVHFNYGLRGEESNRDARFVAELCARMGIALVTEPIDMRASHTGTGAARGSVQNAARRARYAAMDRIGASLGVDKIAVGHTADDQAETLLMWMIRGAGSAGLSGIPPARSRSIIRPLLQITRDEILAYLKAEGLAFRTDSSNAKPIYMRNRIRRDLIPLLKRFNPAILSVLNRQAEIFREENVWLERITAEHLAQFSHEGPHGELVVDRAQLMTLPVALQRRIIRAAVRRTVDVERGPGFAFVAAILNSIVHGPPGAFLVGHGVYVGRDRETLRFERARQTGLDTPDTEAGREILLPVPSTLGWPLTGQLIQTSLVHSEQSADPCAGLPRHTALIDAESIAPGLRVRCWRRGDVFQPFGMEGRQKKLQDFFSDIKMPRAERQRIPIIVASERIVWVAGQRLDHRFRVTSTTKEIIMITLRDPDDHQETL